MIQLYFASLGCDKNLVDTEHMLGSLDPGRYAVTNDEEAADVIVINTCCFIDDAKEESIETILELAQWKKAGKCRSLIVAGCLAERFREEVLKELPEVDAILGTGSFSRISEAVEKTLAGEKAVWLESEKKEKAPDPDMLFQMAAEKTREKVAEEETNASVSEEQIPGTDAGAGQFDAQAAVQSASRNAEMRPRRVRMHAGAYGYLKIAEGCNKHCTYCVIPSIRGSYRSFPMEELLAEAGDLADSGVRELIVIAQETTYYGVDLYQKKMLHVLLERLCEIEEFQWIRILYCYPEEIYPEMIETMKKHRDKIVPYLDLPIQHADDMVLKRMGRRTTHAELVSVIQNLRRELPDIALRTTLISGFPGETEEQHQNLLAFVREIRFDRLGVFAYSQEEGTPAARMSGQIPDEVKQRRRGELLAAQQEISLSNGQKRIGSELEVQIDGYLPEDDVYVARTYADAPDVDGYLFLEADASLNTGDFVRARVTGAMEYDLTGEMIEEEI